MKRILITILLLAVALSIFYITPNYEVKTFYDKDEIRLVIDDTDVTKKLPDPVLIIGDKVMLSQDTVDIYFDKWLYFDENYETFITTNEEHIAKLKVNSNVINIDGEDKEISTPVQKINDVYYFPIGELSNVYDIKIDNNKKIIITTTNPESEIINVTDNKIILKSLNNKFSRTVATANVGDELEVYRYSKDKTWVWCKTKDGDLGYTSADDLEKYNIAEYVESEKEKIEKVNMVWEYSEISTPERKDSKIAQIDVVIPTWINLKGDDGSIKNSIDNAYIKWAHGNNYEVWSSLKNDYYSPEETSEILRDMRKRENIIDSTVKLCLSKNIDGINVDFENMLKDDSKVFSEFIRELSVECKKNNLKISVDVTVPDGANTWSLCYDRYELSEAVDYIVLMAYDEHGNTSKIPGSVASYGWVEKNIKKMVERDGINPNKLILGIPLYTRIWYLQDGKMSKTPFTLTIDNIDQYLNSKNTRWLDDYQQYYYEYNQGNKRTMIWLEDPKSIGKKLELISEYDLGGAAFWRFGYENRDFWNKISGYMNY